MKVIRSIEAMQHISAAQSKLKEQIEGRGNEQMYTVHAIEWMISELSQLKKELTKLEREV